MKDHYWPGAPVRLGTCIAWAMETDQRMARLVAIDKTKGGKIGTYILREYMPGDTWFPTGKYRTTSILGLVPHQPTNGKCEESPMAKFAVKDMFSND